MAIPSADELDRLPEAELLEVLSAYQSALSRRAKGSLLEIIREQLAAPGELEPGEVPVKVIFGASSYDNGWYYSESGTRLHLQGGSEPVVDDYDFEGEEVSELLATLSNQASDCMELVVDLVTGSVDEQPAR